MGQIVHYGKLQKNGHQKTLKWIDNQDSKKNNDDGIVDVDVPQNVPLAKLIPIKETIKFDYAVMTHHNSSSVDPCMRGNKLKIKQLHRTDNLDENRASLHHESRKPSSKPNS